MNEGERRDYRSLGEMIRDAREQRGWSLDQLSERTKIKARMIEAIEADDLERLSGPVYARGFVRTLSEVLELDTPWLLSKLEGVTGAPPKVNVPAPEMPSSTRVVPAATSSPGLEPSEEEEQKWQIESVRVRRVEAPGRPVGRWLGIAAVILVLIAAGVGAWYFFLRSDGSTDPVQQVRTPPPVVESVVESPPIVAAAAESTRVAGESESASDELPAVTEEIEPSAFEGESFAVVGDPVADSEDDTSTGESESTNEGPSPDGTAADTPIEPAIPDRGASAAGTAPRGVEELVDTPAPGRGLGSIVRRGDPSQIPAMELVILAQRRVEVWASADGKVRQRRVLNSNQAWSLLGRDHFSLEFSDPAAVTLELDGVRRDPPPGLDGEWILYP